MGPPVNLITQVSENDEGAVRPIREAPRIDVELETVQDLILDQFPQWSEHMIRRVQHSGWDNHTFHLGSELSIRMPSAERYAYQVRKEQQWLPVLSEAISCVRVPEPVALGKPNLAYPWNWSIYRWIPGDTALHSENYNDLKNSTELATDVARFLLDLESISAIGGPEPGPFYRGAAVSHYDRDTRQYLRSLQAQIPVKRVTELWNHAIACEWRDNPVWVHGDLSPGNILVKAGRLKAVIDFGSCCVGDPACDLVMAWTFFEGRARSAFKAKVNMDRGTWIRAAGWAIWKALFNLSVISNEPKSSRIKVYQSLIIEILDDVGVI